MSAEGRLDQGHAYEGRKEGMLGLWQEPRDTTLSKQWEMGTWIP